MFKIPSKAKKTALGQSNAEKRQKLQKKIDHNYKRKNIFIKYINDYRIIIIIIHTLYCSRIVTNKIIYHD